MKSIFISVGDPSAEIHALKVAKNLKANGFKIICAGGEKLKSISDEFLVDTISLEIFGFSLSILSLLQLYKVFLKVKQYLKSHKPDAVLLVDFYGFNIRVARLAKSLNIKVYYYIPPQVWATRYHRIKNIKKYTDRVFLTLPFEKEIYQKEKIDAVFVGNPLLETDLNQTQNSTKDNSIINIGIFPGSRSHIIKRHIPIMNETVRIINTKINGNIRFYLFGLKKLSQVYADVDKSIKIIFEDEPSVKKSDMDIAISVSGTIATEIALMNIPAVIFYRVSWLNAFILKKIVTTKYVSLPNILLNEEIYSEYIQKNATAQKIAQRVIEYLKNPSLTEKIKIKLQKLKEILSPADASKRVAEIICAEIV